MHLCQRQPPTAPPTTKHNKRLVSTSQDSIQSYFTIILPFCLEATMADERAPVEVGAQGTIGWLVSREMEYLQRLDLDCHQVSNQKQHKVSIDVASTSGGSKQKPGPSRAVGKKKKKVAATGGFLPSICSAMDVADTSRIERTAGSGYRRNLRTDRKKLPEG